MPNIRISALPPAILPLDDPNTLFEVTVLEAGEEVSRKISLSDIAASTGLDASFLTLSANAQLPNERVLTEGTNISFVDTGPNGTLTISASSTTSFPLLAPDGSAGIPQYSFASDPDSGMFLVGADILGLSAGGIEAARLVETAGVPQLIVPLVNAVATPTLAFGDGDSGFFQPLDDNIQVSLVGVSRFFWELDSFAAAAGTGPSMRNLAAGATAPGFTPRRSDPDTGLGSAGGDQLSLIAGGVEIARATEVVAANQFAIAQSGASTVPELTSLADPDTGFRWPADNTTVWIGGGTRAWNFSTVKFFSQFSDGPALMNRLAQAAVPTVVPDHADDNTGLGATGSDVLTLVAGGVEGVRVTEVAAAITVDIQGALNANGVSTFIDDVAFRDGGDVEFFDPTNAVRALLVTTLGPPDTFRISGAGQLEHLDVRSFNTSVRLRDSIPLEMVEFAISPSFVAGSGFFWVRDDVPNVPIFTDDAGTDFILNAPAVSPDPILLSSGGAGVPSYSFAVDTDTGMFNPALDSVGLTVGGVLGLSLAEAGSHVIQTNEEHVGLTASVTQTQAGGLALLSSYNEIAIVGTTGDALTAFGVAVGERLIVINNGANDLQLFPDVGDNIGAGLNLAITIAAGEIGIFIGRDAINWDTLYNATSTPVQAVPGGANTAVQFNNAGAFGGSPDFEWDGSELKVEASQAGIIADESDGGGASFVRVTSTSTGDSGIQLEFNSTTGTSAALRQVTPGGALEDIWISFAEDAGVGIRHNNIQKLLTIASGVQFDDSLYVIEKAAANADIAAQGQFWVRNDIPNTPMFTDDVGTDFVLNDSGIAVSGTPVNNQLAIWTGANTLEGDSQVTWDGTTLRIFESTVAEAIEITPNLITPVINFSGATNVSFTGPSAALGYTFDQGARFGNTLRINTTIPTLLFEIATVERAAMTALATSFTVDVGGQTSGNLFQINNSLVTMLSVDATNGLRVFETGAEVDYIETRHDGVDGNITVFNGLDLNFIGASVGYKFDESIYVTEKAAANADFAGLGQFWVRNDVPNIPMFTDDVGIDFKLGVANDAVQARRTTSFTITTAFTDVTLDTTDIETDAAIIEHSATTDRIEALVAGTYEVTYGADIDPSAAGNDNIRAFGRVRLNDLGVDLPGSLASTSAYEDASTIGNQVFGRLQCSFIVVLAISDFITLQLMKVETGGTGIFTAEEVTVTAKRLL